MYEWICRNGYRPVIVATKLDKIKRSQIRSSLQLIRKTLGAPDEITIVPFSAQTKQGRDEIYGILDRIVEEDAHEEIL
jgi:GTP-binding protein